MRLTPILFAAFIGTILGDLVADRIIPKDGSAEGQSSLGVAGDVILYSDMGQVQTSHVNRIGPTCWVAWYAGIEKVVLRSDRTAVDGVFHYRWTLDTPGPDDPAADEAWFAANCKDAPQ